jgi:hypothetical protein
MHMWGLKDGQLPSESKARLRLVLTSCDDVKSRVLHCCGRVLRTKLSLSTPPLKNCSRQGATEKPLEELRRLVAKRM